MRLLGPALSEQPGSGCLERTKGGRMEPDEGTVPTRLRRYSQALQLRTQEAHVFCQNWSGVLGATLASEPSSVLLTALWVVSFPCHCLIASNAACTGNAEVACEQWMMERAHCLSLRPSSCCDGVSDGHRCCRKARKASSLALYRTLFLWPPARALDACKQG